MSCRYSCIRVFVLKEKIQKFGLLVIGYHVHSGSRVLTDEYSPERAEAEVVCDLRLADLYTFLRNHMTGCSCKTKFPRFHMAMSQVCKRRDPGGFPS